jgi:hypothetical protein
MYETVVNIAGYNKIILGLLFSIYSFIIYP